MSRDRLVIVLLVGLGLAARPAFAQGVNGPSAQAAPARPAAGQRGEKPVRPVFGGGVSRFAQSLGLSASVGDSLFRTDPPIRRTGGGGGRDTQFLVASGNVAYTLSGTRAGASASATTTGQYYSELTDTITRGYAGQASAWATPFSRTRISVDHRVAYLPALQNSFQFGPDPTAIVFNQLAGDVAFSDERWLTNETRVALVQTLNRRSDLTVDYGRRLVDYRSRDVEQLERDAGFRYRFQIGKGLGLRAGYRHAIWDTRTNSESADQSSLDTIDAGIDFSKALSLTRRTTLSVQSGSMIVKSSPETRLYLTGDVLLSHQMLRTWNASVGASRRVDFVAGLREPLVNDRVYAQVGGLVARRVQVSSFASALRGQFAVTAGDPLILYYGGGAVQVAVTRRTTWSSTYIYQQTQFRGIQFVVPQQLRSYQSAATTVSVAVARYLALSTTYAYTIVDRGESDSFSRQFRRHSVMAFVSTQLPLYATVRK